MFPFSSIVNNPRFGMIVDESLGSVHYSPYLIYTFSFIYPNYWQIIIQVVGACSESGYLIQTVKIIVINHFFWHYLLSWVSNQATVWLESFDYVHFLPSFSLSFSWKFSDDKTIWENHEFSGVILPSYLWEYFSILL